MKNFLLVLFMLYGGTISSVFLYHGFLDMKMLNSAFESGHEHAELRHRINVSADGTWILLGNIITLIALASYHRTTPAG